MQHATHTKPRTASVCKAVTPLDLATNSEVLLAQKLFSQWHKIKQEKKTETQATNLYSQILSAREGKAMGVQWAHS